MKYIFVIMLSLGMLNASAKPSKKQLEEMKDSQHWTFELQDEVREYPTGLKKTLKAGKVKVDKRFLKADTIIPGKFHQKDKWHLTPITNQGNCGSCVIFSVVANFMDSLSIRGVVVPALSQQQLMNCGNGGQCNGYWFSDCADDLIRLKGLVADSVYPYTARTGSCKNVSGEKFGQIQGKSIISNAHKSMMNAINAGYPLSVTVGADSPFMNYRGGIYNACTNQGTNHQTVVQGYDCEDQVDANGNCILDSDGYVAAGKGFWYMRNSWGTGWGEQGWMKIKMSKPGNKKSLCNNLNEEVGLLETGIPVPQPKPPEPPPEPPKPPAPSEQLPFWVWLLIGAGGTVILIFVIKGIKK